MIVITVDPKTKQSAFISIPRDMEGIPIPREWPAYERYGGIYSYPINTLFSSARINPDLWAPQVDNIKVKGYAALEGVLGELYGLDIDYYVSVDLKRLPGRRSTRSSGTMIDVQNPVYDYHYPADDGVSRTHQGVRAARHPVHGRRQALAYARARKLTSDFDRADRQQRVVTSLREQVDLSTLLSPGVIDDLLRTVQADVRTDIPVGRIPKLISLAQTIDLDERISLVLTPPTYRHGVLPPGRLPRTTTSSSRTCRASGRPWPTCSRPIATWHAAAAAAQGGRHGPRPQRHAAYQHPDHARRRRLADAGVRCDRAAHRRRCGRPR